MTLEQIYMALQDRRLSVVSEATGLSVQTLRRFRDGKAMKPAHDTMQKLTAYLGGRGDAFRTILPEQDFAAFVAAVDRSEVGQ